jgi:hypothetical protein
MQDPVKRKTRRGVSSMFIRQNVIAQLVMVCVFVSAHSWGDNIAVDVYPSSIAISPWYRGLDARVALINNSSNSLFDPTLEFFGNDGFQVKIGPASETNVGPGASIVWPILVTNLAIANVPGAIQFEASFAPAAGGSRQKLFSTLNITPATDTSQQSPIQVMILGTFDAIEQYRPSEGYLVVSNNLGVPVRIARLEAQRPKSITFTNWFTSFTINPHSVSPLAFELEAEKKVTPGTYPLLLDFATEWETSGHTESRSVIVSQQVGVGVFFESELLKALGVPSFLLLPGCLFLSTMQLLVTMGVLGVKNLSRLPQLAINSPGFWIIAVTFSGLFAVAYNWITGTNYLVRYGADDLLNVWLWSILIGLVVYLVIALVTIHWRKTTVPTSQDAPITILRKMCRHRIGILVAPVKFQLNKVELRGFPIEGLNDEQTFLWVIPKIVTTWADSAKAREAQQTFEQHLNARSPSSELADELTIAIEQKWVNVSWQVNGSVPNPYHLKAEAIAGYDPPEVMVESR